MGRARAATNTRLSVDDWIQAGFGSLAEEGIKALKIDRLCGRLSVTKGSFYWHFTDIAAYRAAGVGFLHLAGAHPGTHAAEGREGFLDIMLKP